MRLKACKVRSEIPAQPHSQSRREALGIGMVSSLFAAGIIAVLPVVKRDASKFAIERLSVPLRAAVATQKNLLLSSSRLIGVPRRPTMHRMYPRVEREQLSVERLVKQFYVRRGRWSSGGPAEEGHPNRAVLAGRPAVPKSSCVDRGDARADSAFVLPNFRGR
jgi:hypothetical protein